MNSEELKKALDQMYDLGYKHGYEMAKRDMQIKQLEDEIERLGE